MEITFCETNRLPGFSFTISLRWNMDYHEPIKPLDKPDYYEFLTGTLQDSRGARFEGIGIPRLCTCAGTTLMRDVILCLAGRSCGGFRRRSVAQSWEVRLCLRMLSFHLGV